MSMDLERLQRMDLNPRMAVHGRIRMGKKSPSGAPMKIPTFRFTSSDREALVAIAAVYGGDVAGWEDPKAGDGQFEVITTSSKVRIQLPPDPLGGTPIMEQWTGGGCARRCDAGDPAVEGQEGCTIQGRNGPEQVACMCLAEGAFICKPKTRLSVILPDTNFGGAWRLDTNSRYAAMELPAMIAALEQAQQATGLPSGFLLSEERVSKSAGKTHRFMVPKIVLDMNVNGETSVAIGAPATAGALGSGEITDDMWESFKELCAELDDEGREAVRARASELGRAGISRAMLDVDTIKVLAAMAANIGVVEAEIVT